MTRGARISPATVVTVGLWIAIIVVAVVVVAALVVAVLRRNRSAPAELTPPTPAPERPVAPEPPPMSDLESALAKVTDRTGRPIGERMDAEAAHIDDLRVPDDTGPLLRRALDSVAHHDSEPDEAPDPPPDETA